MIACIDLHPLEVMSEELSRAKSGISQVSLPSVAHVINSEGEPLDRLSATFDVARVVIANLN